MIKKLLLIPLMGIISFGAFASADTIDGFISDSAICKNSFGELYLNEYNYFDGPVCDGILDFSDDSSSYICVSSSTVPYYSAIPSVVSSEVSESVVCYNSPIDSVFGNNVLCSVDGNTPIGNVGSVYFSKSPITYSSSSDDSGSSLFPGIPENFTSGLTSLVSNFGSTIVNWLPTIILVSLGIYAIFALFRTVRGYARSSFNG